MFGNDRMETTSTAVMSILRRNDIEKSTWRTDRYFVNFDSRIHVEISRSNRRHNFRVDSSFKIEKISTNFPRRISKSNRWQIDEDVPLGPANKWDRFKNYFLEKLLLASVLSALGNFLILSGKPDWLSLFLFMYWSCSPQFYLRKGGFRR